MIKRYGLGSKRLGGIADTSVYGPDIIEMKDGDYVRYEHLQTLAPRGWQLVPIEPTEEMVNRAFESVSATEDCVRTVYMAMLNAAPKYKDVK